MTPATHLASLACALGAVVFATVSRESRLGLAAAAAAFAGTIAWPAAAVTPAVTGATGLLVAGVAVLRVIGRGWHPVAGLAAGWLAATWAVLLQTEGVPVWAGIILAVAMPCLAVARATRQPSFAPPRLCEDALIMVALVGLGAAAAPGLAEGWRAAVNLKFGGAALTAVAVPAWTIGVSLAAAAAGAGYGAWSRR